MRRNGFTEEMNQQIIEMWNAGVPVKKIATAMRCGSNTLRMQREKLGLKARPKRWPKHAKRHRRRPVVPNYLNGKPVYTERDCLRCGETFKTAEAYRLCDYCRSQVTKQEPFLAGAAW